MHLEPLSIHLLELLADRLDTIPPDSFGFNSWVTGGDYPFNGDLMPTLTTRCGTTGCAAAWATTIPEIRDRGLVLHQSITNRWIPGTAHNYADPVGALSDVFEISRRDVTRLFFTGVDLFGVRALPPEPSLPDEWSPKCDASAQDVAAHIRRFIRTDGTWIEGA